MTNSRVINSRVINSSSIHNLRVIVKGTMKACTRCKREHNTTFKYCLICREYKRQHTKEIRKTRKPKFHEKNQRECIQCFNVKNIVEFKSKRSLRTTKKCSTCRNIAHRSQNNPTTVVGKCKKERKMRFHTACAFYLLIKLKQN